MKKQKILEVISSVLGKNPEELTNDMGLGRNPGWDSLDHVQIFQEMENQSSIKLSIDESFFIETVEDFLEAFGENNS